jgi:hypothetical protein
MNPEVALILSIMSNGRGMSYGWSGKSNDLAILTDKATGRIYKIEPKNYEIAFCIDRLLSSSESDILEVKLLLLDKIG